MHVLEAAEIAVQVAADRPAEGIVVVEREAERRDGVAVRQCDASARRLT